jgi:hypothetical protein
MFFSIFVLYSLNTQLHFLFLPLACDPGGEKIHYFDKNLDDIGHWNFSNREENTSSNVTGENRAKNYVYSAEYLPDGVYFCLINYRNQWDLSKYNTKDQALQKQLHLPLLSRAYNIHVDSSQNCLIADAARNCLISIDQNFATKEFTWPSLQAPYAMTFLSTGTLCITSHAERNGSKGGICIISENDLKN